MVLRRWDQDTALRMIGNVVWPLLCGWWLALRHLLAALLLCVTIIRIPLGVASFKMAILALWPYGRTVAPIPPDIVPPPGAYAMPTR
jgi:uncharacterized membrane protein YccF (DUF307 family)